MGYITLDEMKIRENLVLKDGKLVGLADVGIGPSRSELASHMLVYYVRSIDRAVSQPFAWYSTKNVPAWKLANLTWGVIIECEKLGFEVHAVVSDGHASNRKMYKLMSGCQEIKLGTVLTAPNPSCKDRPIHLLSDPSHLLKTVRNSLYNSRPGGSKFLCMDDEHILWSHVEQLYYSDAASILSQSKLTQSHIILTPYSKMKVDLARGVLCWNVGRCLSEVNGAKGTSKFILLFAEWFDHVNSGHDCPIKIGDRRLEWLEKTFVKKLLDWEEDVSKNHRGEHKRIIARPTLEGLIFTTLSLVCLAKRFLAVMPCIWLKSFTQDILEACFGNLRMQGHRSRNPDVSQAYYKLQQSVMRKGIKKIKGSNQGSTSTHGSNNVWETICSEPVVKRKKN